MDFVIGCLSKDFSMNDQRKTKAQLIQEISGLRQRLDLAKGDGDREHKQCNEARDYAMEKYQLVFDDMLESCQVIGFDWDYLYLNRAAAIQNGVPNKDILGKLMTHMWPGIEDTEGFALLRRCMEERVPISSDIQFVLEDGSSRWFEVNAQPAPEGILVRSIDITERRRLKQELQKSQKLESIGLLTGGLAHEFNNALATIQLQTSVATLMDDVPNPVLETLKGIERSVEDAKSITQKMLAFSKGGAQVRATTDIGALIRESVQSALSGTNTTPTFDVDAGLHTSEVDPNQISQVVNNLAINAHHAMPEGGEIKIAANNISVTSRNQVGTLKPGEYVMVSLEDQGHGIEPADLAKIFDPYFTTKERASGLGLFFCSCIIDKHDGWMTAESQDGKGSVFTFYLPKSHGTLPESTKSVGPNIIRTGNILIMDDEPVLRVTLALLLNKMGYTTTASADGEEAIQAYSEAYKAGTPFDVVILDLILPKGIGGAETFKRLKKTT